jgi:DUF1680 family protein
MDSDIYKTLEAIGWERAHGSRPDLATFAAAAIDLLAKAQDPDGYLDSYFQVTGEPRYARLAWSHEIYCAGHLIQAAIATKRAAGDDRLLGIAIKLADHLVAEFTDKEDGLDGHPIIETALAELYRETANPDYLSLASQFIDQRGRGLVGDSGLGRRYLQDHLPVREAVTEEGHVVRALYLEAGVVDVAVETGDHDLLKASIRRWDDMIAAKTYLTGGNGSRHSTEGFGDRFELPPDRAYTETCAAIASIQWSWRLLLATGHARYADHIERVLYNGFGAAISADGQRFFYVNPLQRREDHFEKDDPGRRHEWFSCACCPPNIMRLLASIEHYLATTADDTLYLHQFTSSRITTELPAGPLDLDITTDYPWTGDITITVRTAPAAECALAVRIPPWTSATARVTINNREIDPERVVAIVSATGSSPGAGGYFVLRRHWQQGDTLTCHLDLTPRLTYPHRRVDAVRGCAAIERGPLVYCVEQADQPEGISIEDLELTGRAPTERAGTLAVGTGPGPGRGRTVLVTAEARHAVTGEPVTATAVPYFQWDNRDPGPMRVWLPVVVGDPGVT